MPMKVYEVTFKRHTWRYQPMPNYKQVVEIYGAFGMGVVMYLPHEDKVECSSPEASYWVGWREVGEMAAVDQEVLARAKKAVRAQRRASMGWSELLEQF